MPDFVGGISGVLSAPLMLPASLAGALAALFVVLAVIAWRRTHTRLLLPIAGFVLAALAVWAVIDQLSLNERAAARRALLTRDAELTRSTLVPGSALACLDAGAGDAVETVCEKMVFASAQSAASAVAYMEARLKLLADAAATNDDADIAAALASTRRAVVLDRYGIAAHVLATRDGCTTAKCAAFALVDDASALRANLRAQTFDQYVSRYAANWSNTAPLAEKPPLAVGAKPTAAVKAGEPWDFPSAASIPPVSIMNAEPPPPKTATTQAPADRPRLKGSDASAQAGPAVSATKPAAAAKPPMPLVPPKRQQPQAVPPPAR
jgi:hypothetical protein